MDAFIRVDTNEPGCAFDLVEFISELRATWPAAKVYQSKPSRKTSAFTWLVFVRPEGDFETEGFISRDGYHIGLKGLAEDCLRFARWVGSNYRGKSPLLFGDGQHVRLIDLSAGFDLESEIEYFESEQM
ncbi:hypothetical protein [Tuwongella immobilis]|uniref:Uncharacterized protein n=1 Tax=Tuwongella immobilis TaxID=692036 RepID=A0A6C2YVA8_9BACT|nr:hypothetical protein [Tuwongella immobilis]VIP05307.1 unnamed protein product [Tuwongella immobilis]VTS07970.1 unnamed protein product [Tuwongella immobilis]